MIGLISGALLGAMGYRTVRQWYLHPEAVMTLLQTNLAGLKGQQEAGQCVGQPLALRLFRLEAVSSEIVDAFLAPGAEDERFADLARKLEATVARLRMNPPTDCAGLERARAEIGQACKACHDLYRG
jgi:hypothetical protein